MKKMKRFGSFFLASALLASLLAGCGNGDPAPESTENVGSTAEESTGAPTISIVFKTTSNEYTQYMMAGANKAADELGVTLEMKGATSETAYDEQQNMIETDLNAGKYDAMIIAPLQGEMVSTLVSGTSMPIFAIDTDFEAEEKISFIGIGQADAAASGGEAAVAAAKAAGWTDISAAYIAGVQGDSTAEARKTGFQKGIEDAGGTFLVDEIQYADAVADKAANCMEAIMQNHPEGVAIIACNNDDMAMAAARTASGHAAYANTIFLGFDGISSACESILVGEETLSVAYDCYDLGYKSVEAAVQAINNEDVEENISVDATVIDKDTAQERLDYLNALLG